MLKLNLLASINTATIIAITAAVVLVLVVVSLIFIFKFKKKTPKIKVDQEFMSQMVASLGGIENIVKTDVENGRLKIELDSLDKANFNKLKELSQNGVFVTGSTVKVLFKLDSKTIQKEIENMKR